MTVTVCSVVVGFAICPLPQRAYKPVSNYIIITVVETELIWISQGVHPLAYADEKREFLICLAPAKNAHNKKSRIIFYFSHNLMCVQFLIAGPEPRIALTRAGENRI